jgi:hypothetical protein
MPASAHRRRRSLTLKPARESVEERLHHAHQQLTLFADVFELQAVVPDYMQNGSLSPAACSALAVLSRQGAAAIRELLDELPPNLKNLSVVALPGSRRGSAGR